MTRYFSLFLLGLTSFLAADAASDRAAQNRRDDIKRQQRAYDNRQFQNRQDDIRQQELEQERRAEQERQNQNR
ncbi:MAG: hypothetical protein LLF94_05890 [Chlamydiales bacterium]|nr:hypothetical protein [Chlamydiales bacterium]